MESFKNSSSNNVYLPYFRNHKSKFIYSVLDSTSRSNSSLCHQLALNIIFNKPLSSSENYSDELLSKYKALEHFFKEIPLEWSNMKVLGAELGKYIIVARKDNNSSSWIVAGIMDEDSSQKRITFD